MTIRQVGQIGNWQFEQVETDCERYNQSMFDVDLMPLCIAPFAAIFVACVLGGFLVAMSKRNPTNTVNYRSILLICITVTPIICILSIFLQIGTAVPHPWVKPSMSDISGKWTLSKCTNSRFKEQWHNFSNTPGRIEFKGDNTFVVENLPAPWALKYNTDIHTGEYLSSGSGTWYTKSVQGRLGGDEWMLYAQFQQINNKPGNRLIGFYFNGQLPPYNLAYFENINLVVLSRGISSLTDFSCT